MIDNTEEAKELLSDYDLTDALIKDEPHDIISEVADSNVDVYNYDLLEWVKDNYQYVEEAMSEFGHATNDSGDPDFIKQIMQGQYYRNEQLLWEAWEDIKEDEEFNHFGSK
jgi:hypothetical protein